MPVSVCAVVAVAVVVFIVVAAATNDGGVVPEVEYGVSIAIDFVVAGGGDVCRCSCIRVVALASVLLLWMT